ncbi:hypothetical protein BH09ACT12_BH09ACT12_18370 [soil metagenome]
MTDTSAQRTMGTRVTPVYLHLVLMKTGTTYLQRSLRQAGDALTEQGLTLIPGHQPMAHRLSLALRGLPYDGNLDHNGHRALDRLAGSVAASAGRCLLTEETLSFLDEHQAETLVGALGDAEVHVVVTVRDIARALPSAWQQRVKNGHTVGLADYLEDVRAHTGLAGRSFWLSQSVADVLARWSALVPPERVHVVVVPPSGEGSLLERFCSVIGIDPASLPDPGHSNPSLGYAQTELLRRINQLLPDEMGKRAVAHGAVIKRYFARDVLAVQDGLPIRMPDSWAPWCEEQAHSSIAALESAGYHVIGDLSELVPRPASYVEVAPSADEAALLTSATQALVALLVERAGVS